jgi:hypothetical protein
LKQIFLILLILALSASCAIKTGTVILHYDEPVLNSDGSELKDLDHISIYYFRNKMPVKAIEVPATKPTGGGINIEVTAQYSATIMEIFDLSFFAIAVNTAGNESVRSNIAKKKILKF